MSLEVQDFSWVDSKWVMWWNIKAKIQDSVNLVLDLKIEKEGDAYFFYDITWKKLWVIVYDQAEKYISFVWTSNAVNWKFQDHFIAGQFQDYLWDCQATNIRWLGKGILKQFFQRLVQSGEEVELQIENTKILIILESLQREWVIRRIFHLGWHRYSIIR